MQGEWPDEWEDYKTKEKINENLKKEFKYIEGDEEHKQADVKQHVREKINRTVQKKKKIEGHTNRPLFTMYILYDKDNGMHFNSQCLPVTSL